MIQFNCYLNQYIREYVMTTIQSAVLAKFHDDVYHTALKQKYNIITYNKSLMGMIKSEVYSYLLSVEKDFLTPRNYNNKTKTAHSEFYTLANKNKSFTASHFFRRGAWLGGQINVFSEVIDLFSKIFKHSNTPPKKMLIAGIGQSQEPFSYLAAIKEIIGKQRLEDVLDLNTIDMQAKPPKDILFEDAFMYDTETPQFAQSSFIQDKFVKGLLTVRNGYRVNNSIFNYLYHTYNNKQKALWAKRLQDEIVSYPTESFDVVSVNNVIGYINDDEEYYKTLKNLHRIIKPNGYIITDLEFLDEYAKVSDRNDFKQVGYGIFQKTNKSEELK